MILESVDLLCRGGVINSLVNKRAPNSDINSPEGLGYRSKVYPLHQAFIARHWRRILHDLEHLAKKELRNVILGVELTTFEAGKIIHAKCKLLHELRP